MKDNGIIYQEDYVEVVCSNGSFLIDIEDIWITKLCCWFIFTTNKNKKYVSGHLRGSKPQITVLLHRYLLNPPSNLQVDHKDGNGLNNRRNNLRIATTLQNAQNKNVRVRKICKYPYKGVHKATNKWKAKISFNCKQIFLGSYNTMEEAARAYDKAAKELFGEFAVLNFPCGTCIKTV